MTQPISLSEKQVEALKALGYMLRANYSAINPEGTILSILNNDEKVLDELMARMKKHIDSFGW